MTNDAMEGAGMPFNGDGHMMTEFLKLKEQFGITHVIETGTYKGDTTLWLSDNFNFVITIEANPTYRAIAQKRFKDRHNIILIPGDSSKDLADMITQCGESNLLIFLDAHWNKNPVLRELEQIKESGKYPVLAIHDFQNPDVPDMGFDVYPNEGIIYDWKWIESRVEAIYPKYEKYYNQEAEGARRGCIFITPKL
jgi:hypothetical protein